MGLFMDKRRQVHVLGAFKIYKKICLIILILLINVGCSREERTEAVAAQEYLLGTDIVLNIEGKNAQKTCDEIFARVREIEKKMTVHTSTDSEIIKINSNAGLNKIKVSADTYYVLEKAIDYGKITGGAFDPTIGPLVKLWNIGSGHEKVPFAADIDKSISLVDYKQIMLTKEDSSAYLTGQGQSIDLGGIAKGYAGDEAKKILMNNGFKSGILNLGGNVMAVGKKKDGSMWRVGIQKPLASRGTFMGIILVEDKAVVTSGGYERFFIEDGKQYHHIINPQTGFPDDSGLISVTIIANKAIDADALSTGVYILGFEKGLKLIESLDSVDAILITGDKHVYTTEGIKDKFQLTDKDFLYDEH